MLICDTLRSIFFWDHSKIRPGLGQNRPHQFFSPPAKETGVSCVKCQGQGQGQALWLSDKNPGVYAFFAKASIIMLAILSMKMLANLVWLTWFGLSMEDVYLWRT